MEQTESAVKPYTKPIEIPLDVEGITTRRDFLTYCTVFDLGPDGGELKKYPQILDVGAGHSNFADTVNSRKLAHAVALDAKYAVRYPDYKSEAVAAKAQQLPFPDQTFDLTLSSFLLPWIRSLNKPEAAQKKHQILSEFIRVTKDQGLVKIHPASLAKSAVLDHFSYAYNDESLNAGTLTIIKDRKITATQWDGIINKIIEVTDFHTIPFPLTKRLVNLLYQKIFSR